MSTGAIGVFQSGVFASSGLSREGIADAFTDAVGADMVKQKKLERVRENYREKIENLEKRYEVELSEMSLKLARCRENNATLEIRIDTKKLIIQNKENRINKLERKLQKKQRKVENLRGQLVFAKENADEIGEKLQAAKENYLTVREKYKNLKQDYQELKSKYQDLKENLSEPEKPDSDDQEGSEDDGNDNPDEDDNPRILSMSEAKELVRTNDVDEREYREPEYVCWDFAKDFREAAMDRGYEVHVVVIEIPNSTDHAECAFRTESNGIVFLQPQDDILKNPLEDDTLMGFGIEVRDYLGVEDCWIISGREYRDSQREDGKWIPIWAPGVGSTDPDRYD